MMPWNDGPPFEQRAFIQAVMAEWMRSLERYEPVGIRQANAIHETLLRAIQEYEVYRVAEVAQLRRTIEELMCRMPMSTVVPTKEERERMDREWSEAHK